MLRPRRLAHDQNPTPQLPSSFLDLLQGKTIGPGLRRGPVWLMSMGWKPNLKADNPGFRVKFPCSGATNSGSAYFECAFLPRLRHSAQLASLVNFTSSS